LLAFQTVDWLIVFHSALQHLGEIEANATFRHGCDCAILSLDPLMQFFAPGCLFAVVRFERSSNTRQLRKKSPHHSTPSAERGFLL
jgi:hypothetical protein